MSTQISKQQIKHIASLAKLRLSDEELGRYENEFNQILEYISQIEECDTDGIKLEHNLEHADVKGLREDRVNASKISQEKMFQNATDGRNKNGYIRVKKGKIVDEGA